MNKMLFLAMLLTPTLAFAQTAPATTTAVKTPQQKEASFDARKTKILEKMSTRSADLQKRQQCVQSATTPDALKACMPPKGEHKGCKE